MDNAPIANVWGFLALASYLITLVPSIFRVVFPEIKKSLVVKKLMKYRRQIGLIAFAFSVLHGFILVEKRSLDFFDLHTYWIYIQGVVTFAIFALLAVTSNNWSIKKMKQNWKKLHSLTYLAIFLLTWHVLDKMSGQWSYLTPIGLIGLTILTALFIYKTKVKYQ